MIIYSTTSLVQISELYTLSEAVFTVLMTSVVESGTLLLLPCFLSMGIYEH